MKLPAVHRHLGIAGRAIEAASADRRFLRIVGRVGEERVVADVHLELGVAARSLDHAGLPGAVEQPGHDVGVDDHAVVLGDGGPK